MPKLYGLNQSLGIAIGAIALIALASSGMLLLTLNNLRGAMIARGHSYEVLSELDAFRAAMLNLETGVRGYLLSDDPVSLEPYHEGIADLDKSIRALRNLVADNPDALRRLATAEAAARGWQTTIGEPTIAEMAHPATRGRAAEIESSGGGRRRFDQFRADLKTIQTGEERLLADRQAETERGNNRPIPRSGSAPSLR